MSEDGAKIGRLIPDPEVFDDLSITAMTGWRWDRDPDKLAEGWPPPIYRGRYKFRDENKLKKYKAKLVKQGIAKHKLQPEQARQRKEAVS
jgi:hypothetical protein